MTTISAPSLLSAKKGSGSRRFKNSLATVLVYLAFGIALVPLVWLLYTVIDRGWKAVTSAGWFTDTQRGITFSDSGGGAWHAILGTLEEVAFCAVISVPSWRATCPCGAAAMRKRVSKRLARPSGVSQWLR